MHGTTMGSISGWVCIVTICLGAPNSSNDESWRNWHKVVHIALPGLPGSWCRFSIQRVVHQSVVPVVEKQWRERHQDNWLNPNCHPFNEIARARATWGNTWGGLILGEESRQSWDHCNGDDIDSKKNLTKKTGSRAKSSLSWSVL